MWHRIIQRHFLVDMPTLDGARMNAGKINFAELLKGWIANLEHVHYLATLIKDLAQRGNFNACYHFISGK